MNQNCLEIIYKLKDKEEKLKQKEEELKFREKELEIKEKEIKLLEKEILIKKDTFLLKEEQLKIEEVKLNTKANKTKIDEKELNNKIEELNNKEKQLRYIENVINEKEKEVNIKEKENKSKEEINNNLEKEIQKLKVSEYRFIHELKGKQKLIEEKLEENKNFKMNLLNKENEISKLNDEKINMKQKYENIINNLNKNLNENNLKIKDLEKNINELNRKNELLIIKENDFKNIIKEYEDKIKILEKDNKKIKSKEEEQLKAFQEKDKELNNKITLLTDKENLIKKEMNELNKEKLNFENNKKENLRIKQENNNLFETKKMLIKEIGEKQQIYNEIIFKIEKIKKEQDSKKNVPKELNDYVDKNKELLNNINENQISSLINEYKEEPKLIGLNDIGSKYFMNSVLQCLSQTKPLTDYFLKDKNIDRIFNNNIQMKNNNELQLSPVYYQLIKQLWNKEGTKSFSPKNFINQLEKMNPLFKKEQDGDSKDLIIFIFEQLHKELKRPINVGNKTKIQAQNLLGKKKVFNNFFNEFKKELSIISDIFFGFKETTNDCLNCKKLYEMNGYGNNSICYDYRIFNCLIFPLEEVKKMKYNNIKNSQNNIVSLYECFNYQQKSEMLKGDKRNYCNNLISILYNF